MEYKLQACVTGYGIVDCLGTNPSSNFSKLLDSVDYFSPLDPWELEHCRAQAVIDRVTPINRTAQVRDAIAISSSSHNFSKTMLYGFYAVEQAMIMANVPKTINVAVIVSSVTGGNDLRWEQYLTRFQSKRYPLKKSLNILHDALCSAISQQYEFTGVNLSLYSACATGLMSIDYGINLTDEYDYVIVGGADNGSNVIDISFFNSLQALSNHSAPFDDNRDGFVIGSGAGALILESEEKARARGAPIYATVFSAGNASDGFDRTAPSGKGACLAMEKALINAKMDTVDFVNAHGTGTPAGDCVEYDSIIKVVGNKPIYSNKGKIGHTLAAAGVIETIYSIESMNKQILPPNFNFKNASYDIAHNLVRKPVPFDKKTTYTLNNSFGFGGKCSSMVVRGRLYD